MWLRKKKQSVIDQRLHALGREIERVQGELKRAAQPERGAPPPMASPRLRGTGPGVKPPPGEADDLFAHAAWQAAERPADAASEAAAGPPAGLFDPPEGGDHAVRRKFASYFMAGHFQNLRPRRQERRIVRNKAMVMVGLALLALWILWWFLRTH